MQQTRLAVAHFDGKDFKRTREGYIDALVYPTRIGVFEYRNDQGETWKELRRPENVFKKDYLDTLVGKDYTTNHPNEPEGLKVDNYFKYSHGVVFAPHVKADDGVHTQSRVLIKHPDGIAAAHDGMHVSSSYHSDMSTEGGIWDGTAYGMGKLHYDLEQINMFYNHLSGVNRGRAGAGSALKADQDDLMFHCDAWETTGKIVTPITKFQIPFKMDKDEVKKKMDKTLKIDSHDVPTSEAGAIVIESKLKADAAEIKTQTDRANAAEASLAKLQAEFDILKKDHDDLKKVDINQAIVARTALIERANKIKKDDAYSTMKTDLEIMRHAVKAHFDSADFEKNPDPIYTQTLFAAAETMATKSGQNQQRNDSDPNAGYNFSASNNTQSFSQDGIDWDKDPMSPVTIEI